MMSNWYYIGEKVHTFCDKCFGSLDTTIIDAGGNHENCYCRKCKKKLVEIRKKEG